MSTVAAIFNSRADAERAVEGLRSAGFGEDRISLLTPGTSHEKLDDVPTTETEQPGMGKALGGAVGGALGVAGGLHLGAAAASLFLPGVGPVFAAGIVAAALLGVGGAATGAAVGGALEDSMARELPHDELFVYEDALRRGRAVALTTKAPSACASASAKSARRARSAAVTSAGSVTTVRCLRGTRLEGHAPEHTRPRRHPCCERAHHELVRARDVQTLLGL